MPAELICFEERCRARFPITDAIYNCPHCGGLLEATYPPLDARPLKRVFRERRMSNFPLDASGVWRYRELFPFLDDYASVVTLREGNTPLLEAPIAAEYGGLDRISFKHQGFNPTGSFKDNGMTCGASQARRLGLRRVACVSTGNTSASMAAYAAAGGLEPLIFLPHGNISFGKLAQALEYGAKTFEVEANFDQILALVRTLAERARHLPAQLRQSVSHRRPKDHRRSSCSTSATGTRARLDRAAGWESRQHRPRSERR
jgi:threonine synthase